jgi:hypothetical protein
MPDSAIRERLVRDWRFAAPAMPQLKIERCADDLIECHLPSYEPELAIGLVRPPRR